METSPTFTQTRDEAVGILVELLDLYDQPTTTRHDTEALEHRFDDLREVLYRKVGARTNKVRAKVQRYLVQQADAVRAARVG